MENIFYVTDLLFATKFELELSYVCATLVAVYSCEMYRRKVFAVSANAPRSKRS